MDWFKDYLSNRKQIVKYKSTLSDSLTIKCGVPQGSVLGPLLFLIYVNDIYENSKILSFLLFADDTITKLFYSNKDINNLYNTINQELEGIALWLSVNKLSLNTNKTHFIVFKTNKRELPNNMRIKINGLQIQQVKYTKFLGLYIDDELSRKYHINQVSTKISKITGIMSRARHYLSLKSLTTIYNAMVYTYLTYCNITWTSTYPTRLQSIFMIQKQIVRIMTFSKYRDKT